MENQKSISIKIKLIKMQTLLATVLLFVVSLVFAINDAFIFKKSITSRLLSTAQMLETNLRPTIDFIDHAEATKILNSMQADTTLVSATLFDTGGKVFAQYGASTDEDYKSYAGAGEEKLLFSGKTITLAHELEGRGTLVIQADLKTLISEYKVFVFVIVLVIIGGLVLSFVMANLLQNALSGPITALAKTAREISTSKDFALRVHNLAESGESIEEIEALSGDFNRMLEQIQMNEANLLKEKEFAEKANLSKSVFLANMSHELRTPMHGILSFARFGQQKIETASKEKLKGYFDEIYESGSRLMRLLNDLLDLSKLEAGKMNYDMKECDLTDVVASAVSTLNAFAIEKKLRLESEIDELTYLGNFDGDRILQVLTNLVSNAIKFSNPESIVKIRLRGDGDRLTCSVINHGIGIPEEELNKVFDKFVQSSRTQTGAGGTGLGLAICREIIQQHEGRIWAESTPGGETKFIFELPFSRKKEVSKAAA